MTNDYRIHKKIGQGGSGIVYEATGPDDRLVALKVCPEKEKGALAREALIMAQLQHENIISFVDKGEGRKKTAQLAAELVNGCTLADLRDGWLSISAILHIGHCMLRGLEHIHSHGFIHNDISVKNILIGDNGDVKVADFGLTRPAYDFRVDIGKGTRPFMSPERLRGEAVDERSDLYAAGVVLYYMIARRLPFMGIEKAKSDLPATPIAQRRPEIPPSWMR